MPGSATLDPNILLDDLVELVDDLRDDLHTDFGVRAFRVYTVLRSWDGGFVGDGAYTEVETEITPQPRVLPYAERGLSYSLEPCGIDEAGFVIIKEISLSYTHEELTGKTVTGGIEGDTPAPSEWVIRIREAHGQNQPFRDFKIDGAPFPDREKDIGWVMRLLKSEETF